MDAQTDSPLTVGHEPGQPFIDRSDLRTIFTHLSHELSRPLVSLRMGFDLLLADANRPISDDQRGHVRTMVTLCEEMLHLTRTYLDYAGLTQGARPLCFGTFTVGALVREIDREFAPRATARRVNWECKLDGPNATVTTDATRCQQVFGNLVDNALKATDEGGEVRVQGRVEGARWVVTVEDDGPGIPAGYQERVFEPFFRLPRDERPHVDGNGLGLAICRELVGHLGGTIALHSEPGRGTRVTVRLPVDATETDGPAKRPRS